jgi:hypothetical protein
MSEKKKKTPRYSISVSARTYGRLRHAVDGSLAGFVDDLMVSALEDPTILARVVARCPTRPDVAP